MPKIFLPWLRGSIDLNSELKEPATEEEAEVEKETKAKTKSKTEVKKASGLNKLRGNK